MQIFLLILGICILLVGLCFIGLGIKILMQKNGKFSHTCAFDWDKNRCKDCQGNCSDCQEGKNKIPKIKV